MAVVGLAMLQGRSISARAGDDAPSSKGVVTRAAFVVEIQRSLKADDERLVSLAQQVLGQPSDPAKLEDQVERLRIEAMKAEGDHEYARLRREIAELALREYTEGILPHELATAEAELSMAQAQMVQIRNRVAQPRDEVEKIQMQLNDQKAGFTLDLAESKKSMLVKFTKSHRTQQLDAEIARARSDERARKAQWELAKGRLEKAQKPDADELNRTDIAKRILALLDRAIPIEEHVQARLQQVKKEANPNDAAEKEIRGLMDQLEAIIDEAEVVKAADDFARVKPRLRRAAG
jgi:hypothetical protein